MPLYDYRCENGHLTELLRPMGAEETPCPRCEAVAERQSVYLNSLPPAHHAGDFVMNTEMRAAHDDAMGRKADAKASMTEAVANGFRAEG